MKCFLASHSIAVRTLGLGLVLGCCLSLRGSSDDPSPRLNQIQVIGTHNSYHKAPAPEVMKLLSKGGAKRAQALDYTHRPFAEQFGELGIRQIELDVYADPKGGAYATPWARTFLQDLKQDPGPDPNATGKLLEPGMKVLHIQDIDYISTAATLVEALRQVRDWSQLHPKHVPILILVELKDDPIAALPTKPIRFDKALLEDLEAEIRSVFKPSQILIPDDVRGARASLRQAVVENGWPKLDSVRGKVMFALDNEDQIRDLYLAGHSTLEHRLMFASVGEDHPAAAWFKINDPVADFERIQKLVRQGFLVRTRADVDTQESRRNDPSQRDKALASGAQFVSSDFPEPRREFSDYSVQFDHHAPARGNPVSGNTQTHNIE